jgi:RNA polymerase sigma-70 factor (ECF subfamily)
MLGDDALGPVSSDEAFERDVLACLPDVVRFARALARDHAAADDLVQETFLAAWRGRHTFRPGADLRRWIMAICHHAFLRLRDRARRLHLTDEGTDAELESLATARGHSAAQRDGLEARLGTLDLAAAIRTALDALPEPFRTVTVMVDVHGATYEEVAAQLGVPIGTVRSRLFRARRLLQEALIDHARDAGLRPPRIDPEPESA